MPRPVDGTIRGALLLTVAVGVVVTGTAFIGAPDSVVREHPVRVQPVERSTSVCPYVGGEPLATSQIGVLAVPGEGVGADAADSGDEPASVRRLAGPDGESDAFLTVGERGLPALKEVDRNQPGAYAVRAAGAMAPGVAAEQFTLARGPNLRGVATARCAAPAREHWFVGAGTRSGQRGRLVLTNPSDTAAVVTVSLWDESGPLQVAGTKDISVAARSQQVLLLDAYAGGSDQLGVRVRASQGRVNAAIEYREAEEGESRGVTMIPAAAAPAKSVVVPGVPDHGRRSLQIVAPGEADAIVSVQVLGTQGPFSPLGLDVVTVPAGSVVEVPLDDALGEGAAAISLQADEAITAAVRVVVSGEDKLPELAYTSATAPLADERAAAVLSRHGAGMSSRLLFSAVGDTGGGRVSMTTLDADGNVADEQTLQVPAGSTVSADLESADGTGWAFALVESAAPNTVVAVREIHGSDDDGPLLDLMPLEAPVSTVRVPTVVGEFPTGLHTGEAVEPD